jgi:hypothetical protein
VGSADQAGHDKLHSVPNARKLVPTEAELNSTERFMKEDCLYLSLTTVESLIFW